MDVARRRLERGNTLIELNTLSFDLMRALVVAAPEPVTYQELAESVWRRPFVSPDAVAQRIKLLRRSLTESGTQPRYIEAVRGRGYRLIPDVQVVAARPQGAEARPPAGVPLAADVQRPPGRTFASEETRASRKPRSPVRALLSARPARAPGGLVVLALVLAGLTNLVRPPSIEPSMPPSLAILPFKPVAPDNEDASLQYGIADTLISRFQALNVVAVHPLSSVRRFGRPDQDPIAAARALAVDSVLDGTFQHSGDRVRVTARLLGARDGRQLWSETFDEPFTDLFEIQDAIAAKVIDALAIRLTRQAEQQLGRRYTDDVEAYQLYLSGWFQRSRSGEAGYLSSIQLFEQAIARDPNYPQPYVGLADSYVMLAVFGAMAPAEAFPLATAAASRALELDDQLAEAHAALAHIKVQYDRDMRGAEREFQRALAIDPNAAFAHMHFALYHMQAGRFAEALDRLRHAQELEPLFLGAGANIGMLYYFLGRYDDAIEQLQRVLQADPGMDHARSFLGRSYLRKGEHDRAIVEFGRRMSLSVGSYADLGSAYALAGRTEEAVAELDRLLTLARVRYIPAYDIAAIYASLGDTERAFEWLDRAVAERGQMRGLLFIDPAFDPLRDDPRMTRILAVLDAPAGNAISR